MTYPYGMQGFPSAGNGLGGLPRKSSISGGSRRKFLLNGYVWDMVVDGPLSLKNPTTYIITPLDEIVIAAKLWGAGGGGGFYHNSFSTPGNGGAGGFSSGEIRLRKGFDYTLVVGAGGEKGKSTEVGAFSYGGYPGGGNSGMRSNSHGAGGGGGFSGIFKGSIAQANAVIIAGAGGGGIGYDGKDAGAGGGLTGQDAEGRANTGGNQTAGGSSYWSSGGQNGRGTALQGGSGYAGTTGNQGDPGGGGGGGYYGGSCSGGYSPGGGGSSYIDHPDVTNAVTIAGNYITPPATSESGYLANAGRGGAGNSSSAATDMQDGYSGLIYIF